MNLYNTCVCFAPSFLRSKVLTPQDMVHAKTMNDVLMFIITHKFTLFEEGKNFDVNRLSLSVLEGTGKTAVQQKPQ